jgi:hypothetical protein
MQPNQINESIRESIDEIDQLSEQLRILTSELRHGGRQNTRGSMNTIIARLNIDIANLQNDIQNNLIIRSLISSANRAVNYANRAITTANGLLTTGTQSLQRQSLQRQQSLPIQSLQRQQSLPIQSLQRLQSIQRLQSTPLSSRVQNEELRRPSILIERLQYRQQPYQHILTQQQRHAFNRFLRTTPEERELRAEALRQAQAIAQSRARAEALHEARIAQNEARTNFTQQRSNFIFFTPRGIRSRLRSKTNLSFINCFNQYLVNNVIPIRRNHLYGLSADPNEAFHVGRTRNNCNYCMNTNNQTLEHSMPFFPASAFLGLVNGSTNDIPDITYLAYNDTCSGCNSFKSDVMFLNPPTPGNLRWTIDQNLILLFCNARSYNQDIQKNCKTNLIRSLRNIKQTLNCEKSELLRIYPDEDELDAYLTLKGINNGMDIKTKRILTHYISGLELIKYYIKLNKYLVDHEIKGDINCNDSEVIQLIENILNIQVDTSEIDSIIQSFGQHGFHFGGIALSRQIIRHQDNARRNRVEQSYQDHQVFLRQIQAQRAARDMDPVQIQRDIQELENFRTNQLQQQVRKSVVSRRKYIIPKRNRRQQ